MTTPDIERDMQEWRLASGLSDMGELTARFIEGSSRYLPGFTADKVDEETALIVENLARLNRAGCMTVMSQPGFVSEERKQRAFVAGFADKGPAMRIARLSLYSDLLVIVVPPECSVALKTPVIMDRNQPRGWVGVPSARDLQVYSHLLGAGARKEIEESWSVLLVDLAWGREEHLWSLLDQVIAADPLPHPEISLVPHPEMHMKTDYFC